MHALEQNSREQVQVLPAPERLGAHVVCAIVRRVPAADGADALRADVQANPYACLNLVSEGAVDAAGHGRLPGLFLAGPFTAPVATEVFGPLRSVSIVMQPWLLVQALQLDPVQLVDRIEGVDAARHPGLDKLRAAAERLADGTGAEAALWSALDAWLASAGPLAQPRLALDLLRSQGVRAAAQACGLSERHYRRYFLQHMGLRPSAWIRVRRLEAVMQGIAQPQPGPVALSELALAAGYADQAHMSREARSLVRHSPTGLQQALKGGADAPWSLRPACPISSRREPGPFTASGDDLE